MQRIILDLEMAPQYTNFKTDMIKVGLVFSISHFFITKTSQKFKNFKNFKKSFFLCITLYLYTYTYICIPGLKSNDGNCKYMKRYF